MDRGRARGRAAKKNKKGMTDVSGQFDLDSATAVEASAIPDVLFERGLYWASGRSGVINLVAAQNGSISPPLRGADDVQMRREVAEMMSDAEIATAQREARAWMSAH